VSSCLLGEQVRFNGGHSRSRFLTDELGPHVDWVRTCPEMAIGLGTPRETLRLTLELRLVNRSGTADHTAAIAALPLPVGLDGYVVKAKSPTCGLHRIPRYRDDGQPADRRGRGVFAQRLTAAFPLLPVEEEGRLNDPVLREAFVERVFAGARLRALLSGAWRPRDLIDFHARHKLQLLAHDPHRSLLAGRVVAAAGARPRAETAAAYRNAFWAGIGSKATRGRHTNALLHAFSQVSKELGRRQRQDLLARIEAYRCGQAPLSVPVALLAHHASGSTLPWLAAETYLQPFPADLRLRHHVWHSQAAQLCTVIHDEDAGVVHGEDCAGVRRPRRRGAGGAVVCGVAWWWSVCRDLVHGGAGGLLVGDVLACGHGCGQGLGGDVVHGPGQAAGSVVYEDHGVVADDGAGPAGVLQVMGDVCGCLLGGHGGHRVSQPDPLVQGR